jgi:ribosomal-protein-alanine N-acetyltransferase
MVKFLTKKYSKQILEFEKSFTNNEKYNKKQLNDVLTSKTYFNIGYFIRGELIGYLIANVTDVSVDLFKIFVKDDYREKGIGKKLINYLINHHRNKPIYVEVLHTNSVAITMYLKLGFNKINERKNYYGNGKNAIILVI